MNKKISTDPELESAIKALKKEAKKWGSVDMHDFAGKKIRKGMDMHKFIEGK